MKRGSALLIVLGMLSFMVISAVAFSAYMRYSRLPSSFLRRSSSSRLLVKAALAEAIDEIDAAIGNNPHPGLGTGAPRATAGLAAADLNGTNPDLRTRNHWRGRVYIGTNQLYSAEDTVSTLTLEGLAYIPPPLVNEARYYSRRSQAGCWKKLGFDAGRYAFCAIDVSDFFDVNALPANTARSSSPSTRISLAYLFENAAHTSANGSLGNPSAWDNFMKQFTDDGKVPLISMADWNLAVHQDTPGGMMSQFCQYITGGRTSFYGGIGEQGETADAIRNQVFVTDGWFPSDAAVGSSADDDYDLADPRHQPFTFPLNGGAGSVSLGKAMNNLTAAGKRIRDRISGLGMAELCDYLDEDNVPISLSIPQAERTPMITAIEPVFQNSSVAITAKTEPEGDLLADDLAPEYGGVGEGSDVMTRTVKYIKHYKLDGMKLASALTGQIKALAAYPFRRGSDLVDPDSFTYDGHLALFLTTGDFQFRTRNANADNVLRMAADGAKLGPNTQLPGNCAIIHAQLTGTAPNFSDSKTGKLTEENAVKSVTFSGGMDGANAAVNVLNNNDILTVWWTQEQKATKDEITKKKTWVNNGDPEIQSAECKIRPIAPAGRADKDFDSATLKGWIKDGTRAVTVRAAVWLRVKNGDGETVDLVPACLNDDQEFLRVNNNNSMGPKGSDDYGSAYPVMFFNGGTFDFAVTGEKGFDSFSEVALNFQARDGMKALMCPDPRWNWAPEHWYAVNAADESAWLQAAHAFLESGEGCDCDIFMATSDAGYLQSIYELAFLPRMTEIGDKLSVHGYGDYSRAAIQPPETADYRNEWRSAPGQVRNAHLMWRTYNPFEHDGCARDNFEGGDSAWFVNDGGGYKVNTYSNLTNVLMAAFANTPCDWWAASTNFNAEVAVPKSDRKDAKKFNANYAFNDLGSVATFKWDDLKAIAGGFISRIQNGLRNASGSDPYVWENYWAKMDWDGENSDFCGVTFSGTDELYDVDRKFLYGYWHDCFAVRQQLFLVFVRAEPAMMGGGARGQTPPQLGARAVALVWRDPMPSPDDRTPHRTRVLFYRQFD